MEWEGAVSPAGVLQQEDRANLLVWVSLAKSVNQPGSYTDQSIELRAK